MTFTGFPVTALDFYAGLELDNSKAYWVAHKGTYDSAVKAPMQALVAALEPEFGPGKLFRPNRDIRFSADKSPYKTHQGALVGDDPGVGYYVQIGPEGLAMGGGFHAHSPAETARFRAAVHAPVTGSELARIIDELKAAGAELLGEQVKTAPRGYLTDHPRIELLRHKEIMALTRVGSPPWLGSVRALDEIAAVWRSVTPLVAWVCEHVQTP